MERKIETKALVRAVLLFVAMFVIMTGTAILKYVGAGSFDNESRKRMLYACAAMAISVLLILVAMFTYLVVVIMNRQQMNLRNPQGMHVN